MNLRRAALFPLSVLLVVAGVRVGSARPEADNANAAAAVDTAAADAQILNEIREHSQSMENLEFLSDEIGPRLTGSPQLKQANDWTAAKFRGYGLANVHLEGWTMERSWTRGTATARIASPAVHPLTIASAGWSASTPGLVRGPVIYFDAKEKKDFARFHGKLRGAIVIHQEPASLSPQKPEDPRSAMLRPMQAPPPLFGEPPIPDPYEAFLKATKERMKFWKDEGVVAVLRDSNKPHGLLNMTDTSLERYGIGPIPTAFVTGEGYRMIFRMLKHGPVQVEIDIKNSISDKPMEVYNTVADLRGIEKPDEMVILGAHLDSWDLGTGSTDNGTGSVAVLEAARALAKLQRKAKRTIRFVLFSGEEQGLYGSEAYVKKHRDELENVSAVLVHDTGTGRVLTLGLHDNYQDRELVDHVLEPLQELKLLEPSMARSFGTDHLSFDNVGVPGFFCIQERAEYRLTHHSQSDTFDKAWKDDLIQGAQVLAAWAYNTAQLPEKLPRRPLPYQPSSTSAKSEAPKVDPIAEMDKKIMEQLKSSQPETKADLEYLADRIGPRLTGSEQLDQASKWMMAQFKQAGLSNAHLEPWTIANSWTRGPATGRITSPAVHTLTLATTGWSPGTKGTIRGPVIGVEAEKAEDLEKYRGKLRGAIVVGARPLEMIPPENPLLTPWAEGVIPIAMPKMDAGKLPDFAAMMRLRQARAKFFAEEGVAAVLSGSEKWYGILNMGTTGSNYMPAPVPMAFVTRENYTLLWRLLDSGPVEAEVSIEGSFSGKPAEVYNTVAEIRGSEKPDEVVIIGAHLDSWDLGTGATDNGTGSIAVLEAARALQKLGVKPKRTVRFVLFTGEEQGLNGSRAYVAAHSNEMGKISGVLVHDSGTGKVLTLGLMGNYGARETLDRALYSLAQASEVALTEPTLRTEGGSDHESFDQSGVPAFWCVQANLDYDKTHHSQADTIDRVHWDELTEGAQVLAVFAYNVAQLPDMLPRKPAKSGSN